MYRIMVVDDELLIRTSVVKSIQECNMDFEVSDTAQNGQEALSLMQYRVPDVIITDIKMPLMDGIELTRNVKLEYPDVKVIILSCYSEFEYAQKAIEYGVYSYLLKPIRQDVLNELLLKLKNELVWQRTYLHDIVSKCKYDETDKYMQLERLLLDIFRGQITNLDQYRQLMGKFEIYDEYFCIAAFSCERLKTNDDRKPYEKDILNLTKEYFNKFNYLVVVDGNIYYILAHGRNKSFIKDVIINVKYFKINTEQGIHEKGTASFTMSFGISSCHSDLEEIGNCLKEAIHALKHIFYKGKGSVILLDDIKINRKGSLDKKSIHDKSEKLFGYIMEGNENNSIVTLKGLFNEFVKFEPVDIQLLFIRCVNIYVYIIDKLRMRDIDIKISSEDDILQEVMACETYDELYIFFRDQFIEIVRQVNQIREEGNFTIVKIKRYINENYHLKLSLQQLSDLLFITPNYLSLYFKKETGINITNYIQSVRIENAKKLLKNSNQQIQHIAKAVGFSDYRHFCTVFKSMNGYSPLQYRMQSII